MNLKNTLGIALTVFAIGITSNATFAAGGAPGASNADPSKHFHPKGKMPSKYTKQIFADARKKFPFADKQDFEEYKKGFIAAP
jgi:alkyl sulfatase BDS1-like metallo-beta-lactamase superfamily hydrolase